METFQTGLKTIELKHFFLSVLLRFLLSRSIFCQHTKEIVQ